LAAPSAAPTVGTSAAATPSASARATEPPAPPPSGLSGAACPISHQTGLLPSDRLVDLTISATSTADHVTFVFAAPSSPTPAGSPRGTLDAATPPFSFAGSGAAINLLGEHAVQLRFTGMTIASDTGASIYQGSTDAKPSLPALREAIQYDASEGVIGWYLGFDGPGCVTLSRSGNDLTVQIGHPEAPAG
ncbi:MAG TPA: hypothetical protein VKC59_01410, partial [Candidatus Limnocylindrales bacterium]|nr:hypothetical protein [Candidatus Limnocylindrales bacterium]